MRFRYINIPKLLLQTLRGNYATRYDYDEMTQPTRISYIFKICLALSYVLKNGLDSYYAFRSKWYMLASCTPTYGQIERVMSTIYSYDISITRSQASIEDSYWYMEEQPKRYLYTSGNPPVYMGRGGNYTEIPIINIPYELSVSSEYAQFIADLNMIVPFFIPYTINILPQWQE